MSGSTAEFITGGATVALVLVTIFAVDAARRGAMYARTAIDRAAEESRKWNTLNICAQYELSVPLDRANRRIAAAFRTGVPQAPAAANFRYDARVILNYLDGIAIGVKQGLYIETLARDHLEAIVFSRVENLLETSFAQDANLNKHDWQFLIDMSEKWHRDEPYFSGVRQTLFR